MKRPAIAILVVGPLALVVVAALWRNAATEHPSIDVAAPPIDTVAKASPPQSLLEAAKAGDLPAVVAFIARGAQVGAKDEGGLTALHSAAGEGHVEVVKLLLSHQADVNVRDGSQSTPLHLAAKGGYEDIANLLLASGANANARANDLAAGNTPLHYAAAAKHDGLAIVQTLVARGATINALNDFGETPLDYAMFGSNRDVAGWMLARDVIRSLSPEAEAAVQAGIVSAGRSDFLAAIQQFETARRLCPDCPLPRYYLGLAEAKIPGRELRAIGWFRSYLAAVPRTAERPAIANEILNLQERSTAVLFNLLNALTAAADALPIPTANEADNPVGSYLDDALQTVAVLWARAGEEKTALERVARVPNAANRSQAEVRIALAVALAGDLEGGRRIVAQAIATAERSPRRDRRDGAVAFAAAALADLGDIAGARSAAARLDDAMSRGGASAAIARAQANAGDLAGAVTTAEEIPVHFYRGAALAFIARTAAEVGDRAAATRALSAARGALESVRRENSDVHARRTHVIPIQGIPMDRAGRLLYPPPEPPQSAAQVNARLFGVEEAFLDCFIAEGLLGDFNRTDAWQYRVVWNPDALTQLGLARARQGDQAGAATVFRYLGDPGPFQEKPTKDWGATTNAALARILALHGDEVGARYRLSVARTSAEGLATTEARSKALQAIGATANGWLELNDGLLNDLMFLDLPAYFRALPQGYLMATFNALADTALSLADAQRAIATLRPRPLLP